MGGSADLMTGQGRKEGDERESEGNILRITDALVSELNNARKLLIVTIVSIVVAIPLSWHAAPLFTNSPDRFRFIGFVTIAIAVVFLILGVRQWMAISKWTRKFKEYRKRISEVDRKLDFENESESSSE